MTLRHENRVRNSERAELGIPATLHSRASNHDRAMSLCFGAGAIFREALALALSHFFSAEPARRAPARWLFGALQKQKRS
jgi:hypothetical protein